MKLLMPSFYNIVQGFLPAYVPTAFRLPLAQVLGAVQVDQMCGECERQSLADKILGKLNISYRLDETELSEIPTSGPAVVLANHPHGLLDAALLASILLSVRADVKFLANPLLKDLEGVEHLTIPIDPFGESSTCMANGRSIRRAIDFLKSGGLLVVFPAGEVSHFDWQSRQVADPPWKERVGSLLRLAQKKVPDCRVIPAFIEGRNSAIFQVAGWFHPRLRTALLLRELLAQRGSRLRIRIGRKSSIESILAGRSDREAIEYLRWRCELLGKRAQHKPRTNRPLKRGFSSKARDLAPPMAPVELSREIQSLPLAHLLSESGRLSVYSAKAAEIPNVMAEIARLRELTFRAAGEGTGEEEDRDRFDQHYEQLFVWNREAQEIVGGYRLCPTHVGKCDLYTTTLFRYDETFLAKLGPALELGRSFIRQEYQKDFAPLLLLWKGIGGIVARNPEYKTLFGPVSISSEYHSLSRQIMASFLKRFAWLDELAGLVASRHPFSPEINSLAFDVDELSAAVSDIEERPSGVPVLLRQYLKLGGKLLGFNVDPEFSNVVDGLILVDLTKTDKKLLQRYLGKEEANRFLHFHA